MSRYKDLFGKRFGRLVVSSLDRIAAHSRVYWNCRCECGKEKAIRADGLTSGAVLSCGCFGIEQRTRATVAVCTTHGYTKGEKNRPEYFAWVNMNNRCSRPENDHYHYYGGRGIAVCERWKNSFANFIADMGDRPSAGHSIDRIDVNGNYEPSNCRWADAVTQRANRRKAA